MSQLLIYFKCQIKVYFVHACELNAFRVDSSVALKHVNYLHVQMTVMFHKFYKKIKIKIKGGGVGENCTFCPPRVLLHKHITNCMLVGSSSTGGAHAREHAQVTKLHVDTQHRCSRSSDNCAPEDNAAPEARERTARRQTIRPPCSHHDRRAFSPEEPGRVAKGPALWAACKYDPWRRLAPLQGPG